MQERPAPVHHDPTLTVWVEVDPSALRLAIAATRTAGRVFAGTAPEWESVHRSTARELDAALKAAERCPEA